MSTASRLHQVKTALCDGLLAHFDNVSGMEDLQVASAQLGKDTNAREFVAMAEPPDFRLRWAALGRRARDEDLTIPLLIFARRPGHTETAIREARARAAAILDAIENYFETGENRRIPDSNGDPTVKLAEIGSGQMAEWGEGSDRVCTISLLIETSMTRLLPDP